MTCSSLVVDKINQMIAIAKRLLHFYIKSIQRKALEIVTLWVINYLQTVGWDGKRRDAYFSIIVRVKLPKSLS